MLQGFILLISLNMRDLKRPILPSFVLEDTPSSTLIYPVYGTATARQHLHLLSKQTHFMILLKYIYLNTSDNSGLVLNIGVMEM
jgi:hypothetical protein